MHQSNLLDKPTPDLANVKYNAIEPRMLRIYKGPIIYKMFDDPCYFIPFWLWLWLWYSGSIPPSNPKATAYRLGDVGFSILIMYVRCTSTHKRWTKTLWGIRHVLESKSLKTFITSAPFITLVHHTSDTRMWAKRASSRWKYAHSATEVRHLRYAKRTTRIVIISLILDCRCFYKYVFCNNNPIILLSDSYIILILCQMNKH